MKNSGRQDSLDYESIGKSRSMCQYLSDNVVKEMTISNSDRLRDTEKANGEMVVNIIWKRDRCAKSFEF